MIIPHNALTKIEIPNGVTSIGSSAFYGCSNLTSIVVPNGVESIGSSAFYSCSKLESITLPFVGSAFNVTRAGIHADGLLKNEEIYNIFDTGKFLNRPPLVSVSNTSGLAGIAHWINSYYHLPNSYFDFGCVYIVSS